MNTKLFCKNINIVSNPVTYAQCGYSRALYTDTSTGEGSIMIFKKKKIITITHPTIGIKETKNNRSTEMNGDAGIYKINK